MRNVGDFSELGAIDGGGDMSVFTEEPVENAITSVSAGQGANNPPPKIPEWGQTLAGRVNKLEKKVDDGFAEIRKGLGAINEKLGIKSDTSRQTDTAQGTEPQDTGSGWFA